jgi:DNA ligase-1
MEYLIANNTGSDKDISITKRFIEKQPIEVQDFYKEIVTKNLKIGCTAKTLNKVFGDGFIPEFNVMLAKKFEGEISGDFIITPKLDGVRCVIVKNGNSTTIMSRQGQIIEGLIEIVDESNQLEPNMVYDGELLATNTEDLPSDQLYKKTMKLSSKKGNKTDLEFHCFDMLPIDEFTKGQSKLGCHERKLNLEKIQDLNLKHIKVVPVLYKGGDISMINKFLNIAIDKKQEGIMLNTIDGKYQCKRTKELLKVKQMHTMDLIVSSVEEGEGKYKNMLGRLNVEFKNNIVGVGSGFTDLQRKEIWDNKEKYIGLVAEVQYFEISQDSKTKLESLRFPVFKQFRSDKDEPSFE